MVWRSDTEIKRRDSIVEEREPEVDVLVDLQLSDLLRANLWFWYSKPSSKFSLAVTPILMVLFAVFIFSKRTAGTLRLNPFRALIPGSVHTLSDHSRNKAKLFNC
jgi:hypothetical protein